jgi:iron complex transport system ATP-binding protein
MFLSEMRRPDDVCPTPESTQENPSVPSAPMLSLDAAAARLPGRRIGPFNLEVRAGERIAILGPSGAGKSTLLKLMAGERAPHEGQVTLQRRPLPRWALADLARRRAVLPQSHAVAFGLPVELVVGLGRVAREPDPEQAHVVAQALALAQAGHLVGRRFDTLSGGEQARVQMARVLAQLWDEQGGLLLVDEPLAALDPGLQFELMDALLAFCAERQHALAAVLHDLNQALGSFHRLWLLREGRLVADLASGRAAVGPLEALYGITLRCVEGVEGSLAVVPMRRAPTSATAATLAAELADA